MLRESTRNGNIAFQQRATIILTTSTAHLQSPKILMSPALHTTWRSTAPQLSSSTIRGLSIAKTRSMTNCQNFVIFLIIVQRTTNTTIVFLTIALKKVLMVVLLVVQSVASPSSLS